MSSFFKKGVIIFPDYSQQPPGTLGGSYELICISAEERAVLWEEKDLGFTLSPSELCLLTFSCL